MSIAEYREAVVKELRTLPIHPSIVAAYVGESDDAVRQDIEYTPHPEHLARVYAEVDTTDLHGAGDCEFWSCRDCIEDAESTEEV